MRRFLLPTAIALLALSACAPAAPRPPSQSGGSRSMCGGIAAIQCASGYRCVDDPNDSCDPDNGGADCGGICVR